MGEHWQWAGCKGGLSEERPGAASCQIQPILVCSGGPNGMAESLREDGSISVKMYFMNGKTLSEGVE